jgi:hypothetical protein
MGNAKKNYVNVTYQTDFSSHSGNIYVCFDWQTLLNGAIKNTKTDDRLVLKWILILLGPSLNILVSV